MKKPISGYAVVLWVLAALYAVAAAWTLWKEFTVNFYGGYLPTHFNVFQYAHGLLESIGIVSGGLLAAGFAIELLDQIKWNTLPSDQRTPR